ncbi:hypothetical protein CR51_11925 [Caballeronia megalochromosomata]|nr:hypothetical protein CR51_11925 [Caballeronia megalochromosomata]
MGDVHIRRIREFAKRQHGIAAQNCWIAQVKAENGLSMRSSRRTSEERVKPCPDRYRPAIEEAMRHFGMMT